MKRSLFATALIGAASFAYLVDDAHASGFAIREQSSSALGNAFAGQSAAAQDISYSFFNPATLALHDRRQALVSLSYIIPQSDPKDDVSASTANFPPSFTIGGGKGKDIGENALVPAVYAMVPIGERLRAGISTNAPFGLSTDNTNDWAGRYHAIDSELITVNINPMLAGRVNDWLYVGGGLQIQYARARLTNAIDFGTIGAGAGVPFAVPTTQDGKVKLKADDWGVGGTLGVIVEPREGTRFGVGWRSQIDHTLDGDANFTEDAAGVAVALQGATGAFVDTDIKADLTTPERIGVGAYHELTGELAVVGEFEWTNWSRFDELRIEFDNRAQPDSVTDESWDDTLFFAGGFIYRPRRLEGFTFRIGGAYDQTPVPDAERRTPRLPDADRYWLAVGATYEPSAQVKVDFGYTHIFMDDGRIRQKASGEGNTFRGNLNVEYENQVDIVALQARIAF
ncbi:MAG: transporter [Gammaproteobacteria bacterium]|nr:transporter [Gammaproteobacteria bacterium]NIR83058.1 transporter [Gammaproteobacteria bacterium]NIR90720.1 transporter [Gammaproteobacteria bacterium]NIU04211.1 transporter [Gammaproteobacteria bacterium]NIV51503.1 hypothetical protein [Gammaproteobacteria bacterium]